MQPTCQKSPAALTGSSCNQERHYLLAVTPRIDGGLLSFSTSESENRVSFIRNLSNPAGSGGPALALSGESG